MSGMREAHVDVTIHWYSAVEAVEVIVDRDLELHPDRWVMADAERLEACAQKIREHLNARR
jgi:hypothetical protein